MGSEHLISKARIWAFNVLRYWKNRSNKFFRKFYKHQHQLTSTTSSNRYPELFEEAVHAVEFYGKTHVKILSFGCSTGEECFSLKQYFPQSTILGVDINHHNLKTAIRKNTFPDINFLYSAPEIIQTNGKYDLIFCLSVLCRWEDSKYVTNCEDLYPFCKFEATVAMLANQLVLGGLLIIYNSNFRFEDTVCFRDFEIIPTPSVLDSGFVNKFDVNNNAISEPHRNCIYRKKSG